MDGIEHEEHLIRLVSVACMSTACEREENREGKSYDMLVLIVNEYELVRAENKKPPRDFFR